MTKGSGGGSKGGSGGSKGSGFFAGLIFVSSRYVNQIIKENKNVPEKVLKIYELQKENKMQRETVVNLSSLLSRGCLPEKIIHYNF